MTYLNRGGQLKMFTVLENGRELSRHEHLWQAAFVMGDDPKVRRIVEVDIATDQIIQSVPNFECKQALYEAASPEQRA